jgi:phage terminase Nu1 subunit (DNA packaging protein)
VPRSLIHRRLRDVGNRLKTAREKLAVVDEQLLAFTDTADDTRLRSLVSETPLADRDHREAQRHADTMSRHRGELLEQIAKLERQQDELLDRLTAESR